MALLFVGVGSPAPACGDDQSPVFAWVEADSDWIYLNFMWGRDPNFDSDDAVEFAVVVSGDDKFAVPFDIEDTTWRNHYAHSSNFPCPYRDVYNHTPGTVEQIYQQLVTGCRRERGSITLAWAELLQGEIERTLDQDRQFAVGSWCPQWFRAGVPYWIAYRVRPVTAEHPVESEVDEQEGCPEVGAGFAWIHHDVEGFNTHCPLDIGDPFGRVGIGSEPVRWLNRLCVPTQLIPFAPGSETDAAGTMCCDRDDDGYFSVQPDRMFGSWVGDCDDDISAITTYGYSRATGECAYLCPAGLLFCTDDSTCGATEYCDLYCHGCLACTASERNCADSLDNDCDGDSDEEDRDCCECHGSEFTTEGCSDGGFRPCRGCFFAEDCVADPSQGGGGPNGEPSPCGDAICGVAETPITCGVDCGPVHQDLLPATFYQRVSDAPTLSCSSTSSDSWHYGTSGGLPYWVFVSNCGVPPVDSPTDYEGFNARWTFEIRKSGWYLLDAWVPNSANACGFDETRFSPEVHYILRGGRVGIQADVNQQSSMGSGLMLWPEVYLRTGGYTLFLYDDAWGGCACNDLACVGQSIRVWADGVGVEFLRE